MAGVWKYSIEKTKLPERRSEVEHSEMGIEIGSTICQRLLPNCIFLSLLVGHSCTANLTLRGYRKSRFRCSIPHPKISQQRRGDAQRDSVNHWAWVRHCELLSGTRFWNVTINIAIYATRYRYSTYDGFWLQRDYHNCFIDNDPAIWIWVSIILSCNSFLLGW